MWTAIATSKQYDKHMLTKRKMKALLKGVSMLENCQDNRLTVNCEILATCSSTYSPVRISQEAHSVSIK
jgi:hypothetical protein